MSYVVSALEMCVCLCFFAEAIIRIYMIYSGKERKERKQYTVRKFRNLSLSLSPYLCLSLSFLFLALSFLLILSFSLSLSLSSIITSGCPNPSEGVPDPPPVPDDPHDDLRVGRLPHVQARPRPQGGLPERGHCHEVYLI